MQLKTGALKKGEKHCRLLLNYLKWNGREQEKGWLCFLPFAACAGYLVGKGWQYD